jgi:iron complex transport system permease protein
LSAAVTFVNLAAAPSDRDRILRWLVGGFPEAFEAPSLGLAGAVVLLAVAHLFFRSKELNLVAVSDGLAARSGVDVRRMRIEFLVGSALTAAAVTLAGPIPFVGLVVPHVVRLALGSDHRLTVPVSVFAGAAFVMLADAAAASVWREPLPAGVLTAAIGGPMFLVMLRSADRGKAGLDD